MAGREDKGMSLISKYGSEGGRENDKDKVNMVSREDKGMTEIR